MPFIFTPLEIPEVVLVQPKVFVDDRGYFFEAYKQSEFFIAGIPEFVQDNYSLSKQGTLRGLHFQLPPKTQGKLIRVIEGSIYDVAVDIRKNSLTFGKWVGYELTAENNLSLYVPEGFAHGFVVLSELAKVLYKTTKEYSPEHEGYIKWDDPTIAIDWKIKNPILSTKDSNAPMFKDLKIEF